MARLGLASMSWKATHRALVNSVIALYESRGADARACAPIAKAASMAAMSSLLCGGESFTVSALRSDSTSASSKRCKMPLD